MSFARIVHNEDPQIIKTALVALLNQNTSRDVLELDKEFENHPNIDALFAEFEIAEEKNPPKRDPKLLERWTHYRWIRLELSFIANQRAYLTKIAAFNESASALTNNELEDKEITNPNLIRPTLVDSVNRAIQDDALDGVSISQSIQTLRKVTLQIVGTEHPTDPLSQSARDTLARLANALEKTEPNEEEISKLLSTLLKVDAIPPFRRDVEEEVNRNIKITLDKLYDTLPTLSQSILDAYKAYYGETLFAEHEEEIWLALQGGKQPTGEITNPLALDASWPGFDADGNENITPEVMRYAIRLHRIRAVEKHIATLASQIEEPSKELERKLRREIIALNVDRYKQLSKKTSTTQTELVDNVQQQNIIALTLTDREFSGLVNYLNKEINSVGYNLNDVEKLRLLNEQLQKAIHLQHLTRFSGTRKESHQMHSGVIQQFKDLLTKYKEAVRENTDAIEIKDADGRLRQATELVLSQFQQIMNKYGAFLKQYPALMQQMRYFNLQLRCFGMTYGLAHVRQDSSIYEKVWNAILNDFKSKVGFSHLPVFELLKNRNYLALDKNERRLLQQQLQDGQHKKLLEEIYHRHHAKIYLDSPEYKNNADIAVVTREIERLELAVRHSDMFENIIISNAESAANVLEVESLLRIFPTQNKGLTIVPLLEKRQDLENFEAILDGVIKARIQATLETIFDANKNVDVEIFFNQIGISHRQDIADFVNSHNRNSFKQVLKARPALRELIKPTVVEVMFGFSDTERVSGLPALISVQQVQDDFIQLAADFGVTPKLYHGPGGDPNRGGPQRRDPKHTLQGNARSNLLSTPQSTHRYRETQFYQAYKRSSSHQKQMDFIANQQKPDHIHEWLMECKDSGAKFYEHLHDTANGLGKLLGFMLGQGVHWMVNLLNSSSRATQRGIAENHGDRTASVQSGGLRPDSYIHPDKPRAISASQMKEMLRDNLHLIFGSGFGIRQMGVERAARLYETSATFRDMYDKTLYGIAMTDFRITARAFFAKRSDLIAQSNEQREQWAEECLNDYPALLKSMDVKAMSEHPGSKEKLLVMLSRLFALMESEYLKTRNFLFEVNQLIHPDQALQSIDQPTDMLHHYPDWQEQCDDVIEEMRPLSLLLARLNAHVANGEFIDVVYSGLNEECKSSESKLSGVGRLFGDVGAAITAGRIMQPASSEAVYHDISGDLRQGVTRAEFWAKRSHGEGAKIVTESKCKLFDAGPIEEALRNLPETRARFGSW